MNKTIFAIAMSLFAFLEPTFAVEQSATSPDIVVHLLDYLAKDYGGAVQGGKVISKSEYAEQLEFAEIVEKNARGVSKLSMNQEFLSGIEKLQTTIRSKGSSEDVATLARKLQADAIVLAGIEVAPTAWPDLAAGAKLFETNCVACHGSQGHGDGPAGAGLDPKPANFHDPDLVWQSAPYKFFNTIRLGVPGTGMAAFPQLSDKDVWALAFFVKSLPYVGKRAESEASAKLSLKETSTLTDSEIAAKLGGKTDENIAMIGSIRSSTDHPERKDSLQIAQDFLNESLTLAKAGNLSDASSMSLRAYLEGVEPIEPKMRANLPGLVEEVEGLMAAYRSSIDHSEPISKIEANKIAISAKLREVDSLFSEKKMSPGVAFGAAFSIFLREGFEAVLIIIVLISILRAMEQPQAVSWIHAGWISAVGLGVVAWFASGALLSMSGLSRELLEGSISLLAVIVLIYVGFWLHRYSEMKKWRTFLESKLRHGLTKGSYLGLGLVAFMAVFREAFEVVLFLRAIWIDLDPAGQSVASVGVFSSFALLLGLSYFAIRESKKLPLGRLFQICSWTMIALALILAGKGAHSLQEAGFLPVSAIGLNFRFDLLGIYPSFQTILAQFAVAIVFIAAALSERKPRAVTVS